VPGFRRISQDRLQDFHPLQRAWLRRAERSIAATGALCQPVAAAGRKAAVNLPRGTAEERLNFQGSSAEPYDAHDSQASHALFTGESRCQNTRLYHLTIIVRLQVATGGTRPAPFAVDYTSVPAAEWV